MPRSRFTPPIYNTDVLKTERSHSHLADSNLIIHGDNLHALKVLLPIYAGRVKCIYIDPPYNTGNEGWIYNDRVNSPLMRQWLADNKPVDGEDLERHDKWLCMMWPRLHLLRELLSEDGVIFISIDDNEQHHLRAIMDEIFGESNFVETLVWKKKGGASNNVTAVGDIVENIHMYARDVSRLETNRRVVESARYPYRDDDGSYRLQQIVKTDEGMYRRDTMKFGIPIPGSDELAYPSEGQRWTSGHTSVMEMLQNDLLQFEKSDRGWKVRRKDYFDENDPRTGVYLNLLLESGSLRTAKNELTRIGFAREAFETPKPTTLIKQLLRIATDPNDIVLDSFAGSGTTAHAVLALNKEDGGNRRFILVECEDYADTITAERVRRVINGVPNARDATLREGLGGEFTYCTLGDPISIETMLNGENLPSYASLATYLLHCATGIAANPSHLAANATLSDDTGFFYESEHVRYHLLYRSNIEWLRSEKGALNSTRAEAVSQAARAVGKSAVVFAPLRFVSQSDLSAMGITFCQLPYELTASRAQALEI